MENKPASSLVVSLGKALKGGPAFMRKTGDTGSFEIATPKRVRMSRPKYSGTIRFLLNGRKIWQKKLSPDFEADALTIHHRSGLR